MIALLFLASAAPVDLVRRQEQATRAAAGECPERAADDLVICGHRADPPWRYRYLPGEHDHFDPDGDRESVSREHHRWMDAAGPGALQNLCSPVGAAGWTGCELRRWRESDEQHGWRPH